MRSPALSLVIIFVISAYSQGASAVEPSVQFRPEGPHVISKDASFVLIVDPKTTEKPIRITWSVYNTGNVGIGSFPIVDGKGVCYFSNEDGNATCGPSPFTQAGPTELYIYVITPSGVENKTIAMNISDITIPLGDVKRSGNTVYMNFYVEKYDSFTYKIYSDESEDFRYLTGGVLKRDVAHPIYTGNKTLNPGTYYFAFFAEKNGTYGTNLMRIVIPSGDYLTLETSKESYWAGEKMEITGTTNAEKVSGKIYFPNGTKAKGFEVSTDADNTFSYEFRIPSYWPEGKYNLTTSEPLTESLTFSVADLIKVTPKEVREKINKSDDFSKVITLENLGTNDTNLSVSVSGDLEEDHVSLENEILEGGGSTTLTVSVSNVQADLAGTIEVKTDLGVELEIPVSIIVEEEVPGRCPECPEVGGVLEITPKVWSQSCIAGEQLIQTLTLKNNGGSILDSFTFYVQDVYSDNSLSDLETTGDLNIALSGVSIEPGQSESVDMEIIPYNSGSYRGIVTIKSGNSEAYILVNLDCYDNMSGDISLLKDELVNLGLPSDSDVYSDIDLLLSSAEDAYEVGNYQEAKINLEKARAKIITVQDMGSAIVGGGGIDLTIPIIVVVVILGAGLIFYFKFYRKEEELPEEEFEEEF